MFALALAGISVSCLVYLSIKAARIAIHEVQDRWLEINPTCKPLEEFDGFSWLTSLLVKGRDMAHKTHKTHGPNLPGLPGMIGGGHPGANWLGFHAPGGLPLAIIGVWVFLLGDALLHL